MFADNGCWLTTERCLKGEARELHTGTKAALRRSCVYITSLDDQLLWENIASLVCVCVCPKMLWYFLVKLLCFDSRICCPLRLRLPWTDFYELRRWLQDFSSPWLPTELLDPSMRSAPLHKSFKFPLKIACFCRILTFQAIFPCPWFADLRIPVGFLHTTTHPINTSSTLFEHFLNNSTPSQHLNTFSTLPQHLNSFWTPQYFLLISFFTLSTPVPGLPCPSLPPYLFLNSFPPTSPALPRLFPTFSPPFEQTQSLLFIYIKIKIKSEGILYIFLHRIILQNICFTRWLV